MSRPPRTTLPFTSGECREPSLREVLASLGIENTAEEKKRKRREAAARRCAAQEQPASGGRRVTRLTLIGG